MTRISVATLVGLFLVGCASLDEGGSRDIGLYSEPLRKELTQKRFRARWWNYYERGAILMRYGHYEDAEVDFRIAMSKRTSDTRWARTYGLHFLPEYFPNRELGISLYERGAFPDSERFLELSYGQQGTARAAYYLDRVRERRVRNGNEDTEPPRIEFEQGPLGSPTAALEHRIVATIVDDTYVRSVEVNGKPILLPISARSYAVDTIIPLRAGTNTIRVAATDIVGRRSVQEIEIPTDHDGPALSFIDSAGINEGSADP